MKFLFTIFFLTIISLHLFSQGGEWAWMKGDTSVNASPVWGTKGIGNPANTPPVKYSYYHWQDTSGNFWIYGGITTTNYQGYNDLWKFDVDVQNWIWMHGDATYNSPAVYGVQGIPAAGNTPGVRYFGGLSWTGNDGKFWLVGGFGVPIGDDMWMYDPSINEWTWMSGSPSNVLPLYGTKQIASPYNTPGDIGETNASWVDDNGNLWFYGGQGGNLEPVSALWKYDVSTLEWTWMNGDSISGVPPVYGTQGIPDVNNTPGARWCYASWKDVDGNFMLFAGETSTYGENRNDVWKYNPGDQTWTWVSGDSGINQQGIAGAACEFSSSNIPDARFENRACLTDTCGNVWMYGGRSATVGGYSDLWIYRPQSNDWAWVAGALDSMHHPHYGTKGVADAQNNPGARVGTISWFDHSGNMWLFGGVGGYLFSGFYSQDLWKYIPDASCVSNACVFTSNNVEAASLNELKVYPDPSPGIFTIEIPPAGNLSIEIRNVIGQYIFSSEEKNTPGNSKKQIDLSEEASGIYFLMVKKDDKQWIQKIVIE